MCIDSVLENVLVVQRRKIESILFDSEIFLPSITFCE